jgi:hypothetical protein
MEHRRGMMFLWSTLNATGLLVGSYLVLHVSFSYIAGAIWFHDVTTFDSLDGNDC